MSDNILDNLKSASTWKRGFIMLLFAVLAYIAAGLLFVVVLFQFILKLFSGDTNKRLRELGASMTTYLYQVFQYLSFNSDFQPYPFGDWPSGEPAASQKPATAAKPKAAKKAKAAPASAKKISKDPETPEK